MFPNSTLYSLYAAARREEDLLPRHTHTLTQPRLRLPRPRLSLRALFSTRDREPRPTLQAR